MNISPLSGSINRKLKKMLDFLIAFSLGLKAMNTSSQSCLVVRKKAEIMWFAIMWVARHKINMTEANIMEVTLLHNEEQAYMIQTWEMHSTQSKIVGLTQWHNWWRPPASQVFYYSRCTRDWWRCCWLVMIVDDDGELETRLFRLFSTKCNKEIHDMIEMISISFSHLTIYFRWEFDSVKVNVF